VINTYAIGEKVTAVIERYGKVDAIVKRVMDNGDVLVNWRDRQGELRAKIVRSSEVFNPIVKTGDPLNP
jgi:hypothetical protein